MNRLVIISNEFNGSQKLVLGIDRIKHELDRTVNIEGHGYSKIFDVNLPKRDVIQLDLGVPASFILEIDSTQSRAVNIDSTESQIVQRLLNISAYVRGWTEKVVGAASMASHGGGVASAIDRKLRLASIFPQVASIIRNTLETAQIRIDYLQIRFSDTFNINPELDRALDNYQQGKLKLLQQVMSHQLTTPFHPEDEFGAKEKYFKRLIEYWPSVNPPSEQELVHLQQIVQFQKDELPRSLLLLPPPAKGLKKVLNNLLGMR